MVAPRLALQRREHVLAFPLGASCSPHRGGFPAPFEISDVTIAPILAIASRGVGMKFGSIAAGVVVFVAIRGWGGGLVSKAH